MVTALSAAPKERYLADFQRRQEQAGGPAWLQALRREGIERFAEAGFPTARRGNEPWKYTSVTPIAETEFALPEAGRRPASAEIAPLVLSRSWHRLTFVNGRYEPSLSNIRSAGPGLTAGNLANTVPNRHMERHLARLVSPNLDGFTALNTAFLADGAFIHIAPGQAIEKPIHLLFLTIPKGPAPITHPRVLVLAERGSIASVVETYASLGNGAYFTNAVAEIYLAEGANLDHYKLLLEGREAFHIANTAVHQAADSVFTSASIAAGAELARNTFSVTLDGEGASCTLNGLYQTTGTQHLDNTLFIDHAKPRTTSNEFFKGIVGGKSRAVFGGRVLVRKNAQKVEAHQYDKNLLLSKGAEVDSKPQLEIFADDVKCTHGATAGQLSENDLFYLQARGIDEALARDLLAHAFAIEILDRMRLLPVRKKVEEILLSGLNGANVFAL